MPRTNKETTAARTSSSAPGPLTSLLLLLVALAVNSRTIEAFSSSTSKPHRSSFVRKSSLVADRSRAYSMVTIDAPSKEEIETDRDSTDLGAPEENFEDALRKQGPLEYLEDMEESRELDDPFHILLLDKTFEKPKITVPYVAGSCEYVLDMPIDEATELTQAAYDNGMSCLGTWSREECLSLGKQLQVRDIVCRVVPFCPGGQRGWQANSSDDAADFDYSQLRDAGME